MGHRPRRGVPGIGRRTLDQDGGGRTKIEDLREAGGLSSRDVTRAPFHGAPIVIPIAAIAVP